MRFRFSSLLNASVALVVAGILLAAPFAALAGDDQPARTPALTPKHVGARPGDAAEPTSVPRFSRTIAWWPYETGPYYGDVRAPGQSRPDDVIITAVGAFRVGEALPIPPDLTGTLVGLAEGYRQYFLVQFKPHAGYEETRQFLSSVGAEIIEPIPVNALILRLDQAAYDAVSSSPYVNHVEPWHPAFKIDPGVGRQAQLSPEAAASPMARLHLRLFPGEPAAAVASMAKKLGVEVNYVDETGPAAELYVTAHLGRVPELAKIEAVETIAELGPQVLHSTRGSLFLQDRSAFAGNYTYWIAGIDGDNQVGHVTDTGMSVDAYDFADTFADSGWTGTGTCRVVANHRKVACYRSANSFGGNGDFSACDSADSGGFTHGQIVSGTGLGNATRDEVPAPPHPTPSPGFGADGFWTDGDNNGLFDELQDDGYDGVAKGARISFVDGGAGCPDSAGISSGDLSQSINTTWTQERATDHNFSFGSGDPALPPAYSGGARDIDDALNTDPVNMVFISAGNDGANDNDGNDTGDSDFAGTIGNEASCKNCIPVGGSSGVGGGMVGASSVGPAQDRRVSPILLSEFFDDACRSEDASEGPGVENQTGQATCRPQSSSGTSFSSPNLMGAALIVRDYFAKGFYPDYSDENANNANEIVEFIDGPLVKAILICGAEPITFGRGNTRPNRFNNQWGYGRAQLDRSLPLAADADTVSGLIVHSNDTVDFDGDGTTDGISSLGLPPTLNPSQSASAEFEVLDTNEDLSVVLAWNDATNNSGTLVNDLLLEVRYCGADGTCGNADDRVYIGNTFSEDPDQDDANEDGTFFDVDADGTDDGYWYSLDEATVTNAGFAYRASGANDNFEDRTNNTEAVWVPAVDSGRNDRDGDGSPDVPELVAGTWQVTVTHNGGAGSTVVNHYSLAICGPVQAGSSVRLDKNPLVCNDDVAVIVSETEDATDPGCQAAGSCPTTEISSRVTLEVLDAADVVVDSEAAGQLTFTPTASNSLRFESQRLPLTTVSSGADDKILSVNNNYTIRATYDDVTDNGATPNQRRSSVLVDCQPQIGVGQFLQLGPDEPFILSGGCDDDRYLDTGETFSLVMSVVNIDPIDLIDATVTLRVVVPDNDNDTDECRTNNTDHPNVTVLNPSQTGAQEGTFVGNTGALTVGVLPAQTFNTTTFGFTVTGNPADRDIAEFVVALSGDKTGQQEDDCFAFQMLLDADDEEHFYITDCPTGCTLDYDRNDDEKYEDRIARDIFNSISFVIEGLDETQIVYEDMTAAADEDLDGTPDCEQGDNAGLGYQCGNPGHNGPWDFDGDDENFQSGVTPLSENVGLTQITLWGEDRNWNGVLDPTEPEDPAGNPGLDKNWGTGGGCGWMTTDGAPGSPGGIWHTGTILNWQASHATSNCRQNSDAVACEQYDTNDGTDGSAFWFETLRSPALHPVHFGTDPRDGFDWRTQITDWSWNHQVDVTEGSASFTWEFDLNVGNDDPTLLGDEFIQFLFPSGGAFGLISGGQVDLLGGAPGFAGSDETTGDEVNGTAGGNRAGRRGCYFADLDTLPGPGLGQTAANYQVALPKPTDDDCDNDIVSLGDGCPGLCGVDDDGDGLVDNRAEICRCRICSGGDRDGQACTGDAFCNPFGGTTNKCVLAGAGQIALGDDTCGDGAIDEGVDPEFGDNTTLRQVRNMDTNKLNGVAGGGRGGGHILFNTLEDFFDPVGTTWQTEVGFVSFEGSGSLPVPSYGYGLDDMVIEWKEVRPIAQQGDACSATNPAYDGLCASVSLGTSLNTFDGDTAIQVQVVDPTINDPDPNDPLSPDPNLVDCNGDGTADEVEIEAFSEAERIPETICLPRSEPGGILFDGLVTTTTRINQPGDGTVFLAFNGFDTPSVTVRYIDKSDGVHGVSVGPDGQPGIAGIDDDGDGTVDNASELCPTEVNLAPGRRPHQAGQAVRWSDDECGCVDNPLVDVVLAGFDTADLKIARFFVDDSLGDGDGWADRDEEITLDVLVRNFSSFAVQDLELFFVSSSPHIDCFFDDRIVVDSIPGAEVGVGPGEFDTRSGSDHARFRVGPTTRSSVNEDMFSEFKVIMRGLAVSDDPTQPDIPFSGSVFVQTFRIEHNLDASGATPSTFFEDFESYTGTNVGANPLTSDWEFYNSGDDVAELDGNRCQYNDPSNPASNNGDPADFCQLGAGFDNTEQHWHLHAPVGDGCESPGPPIPATCPDGGRSVDGDGTPGNETASLHLGNEIEADDTPFVSDGITFDQNRMRWAETANSIQLGTGDVELSYWTQMSLPDGRLFGLSGALAMDAGLTYLCVDKNGNNACDSTEQGIAGSLGDGSEKWEPIRAWFSPERQQRFSNFINCSYDPTDDGTTEDELFPGEDDLGPSSTCFPGNLTSTCVGSTDDQNIFRFLILSSTCFPETGATSEGTAGDQGPGLWIQKKYDLQNYRGRDVLIRFHNSPLEVFGVENCAAILGAACFNRDDGWFIDNIQITNTSSTDVTLSVDNTSKGAQSCPAQNVTGLSAALASIHFPTTDKNGDFRAATACNPNTLATCDFNGDGTVDRDVARDGSSDAPGRAFELNMSESTATTCLEGDLQWRIRESTDGGSTFTTIRDWLTDPRHLVDPSVDTIYEGCVRCSSVPGTIDCVENFLDVPLDAVCETDQLVFPDNANKARFTWQPPASAGCAAIYDVAKGALGSLRANGNLSDATCFENNDTDLEANDPATPAAGAGFYYLSRIDQESWGLSTDPGIQGNRDGDLTNDCP